tara:strand:- start:54 stop:1031 length:978 start_codon:yes stop_codon:yes gene_type:complete
MKILTILIFSGDRLSIRELLNDIEKLKKFNIDVRIVEWTKDKENLKKKEKIYKFYKKRISQLKIFYNLGNWQYKYTKYINKFKSKYILVIGDDDRINISNFKKIFKHLKHNYSGLTISYKNFQKDYQISRHNKDKNYFIRAFDLKNDLKRIGFTSCQIIRTDLIAKVFKKEKKYLLQTAFPQNFIILSIISNFNNWKVSNLKCIYNRSGSFNIFNLGNKKLKYYINIKQRLKSEYLGYLIPLKKNYPNLNNIQLKKIYQDIFFNNILSWLFVSIKFTGKKRTFDNIKKVRGIIEETFYINFTLKFIYFCPIFLLNLIRILRRFFK